MNIVDLAILKKMVAGGGGSGTDNYNDLSNLPQINGETLAGNKTAENLGLQDEITNENKLDADLVDDAESTNKFVTAQEKETWNAKQNAIDSSHKLSSDLVDDTDHTNKFVTSQEKETWNAKQNAIDDLSTIRSGATAGATAVQPAELNNYVPNSSLVEVVDNGAKNLAIRNSDSKTNTGYFFTDTASNSLYIPSGSDVHIYFEYTKTAGTQASFQFCNANGDVISSTSVYTPSADTSGTISVDKTLSQDVYGYNCYYNGNSSSTITITNLMICTKSQFGISPAYEPYALGNQILTPELIELCDSGAKNLCPNDNWVNSSGSPSVTFTVGTDGSVNITKSSTTSSAVFLSISGVALTSGTSYICDYSGSNTSVIFYLRDSAGTTTYGSSETHTPFTVPSTANTYRAMIRLSESYTGTIKVYPMICSLAAWNVSHKYVPYRPNWDLVGKSVATVNKIALDTSNTYQVDINSIISTSYMVIKSGSTNFPSGVTGQYSFLRTDAYDGSTARQELTLSDTSDMYVRTRSGGQWHEWKKLN